MFGSSLVNAALVCATLLLFCDEWATGMPGLSLGRSNVSPPPPRPKRPEIRINYPGLEIKQKYFPLDDTEYMYGILTLPDGEKKEVYVTCGNPRVGLLNGASYYEKLWTAKENNIITPAIERFLAVPYDRFNGGDLKCYITWGVCHDNLGVAMSGEFPKHKGFDTIAPYYENQVKSVQRFLRNEIDIRLSFNYHNVCLNLDDISRHVYVHYYY
ncbi:hypothetical protein BDF22DRAFT_776036, partial [Syncephalis plumigaleata]